MKTLLSAAAIICIAALSLSFTYSSDEDLKEGFVLGNPNMASVNQLSFGPDGILFVGDSKNATVYALDTKDTEPSEGTKIDMQSLDQSIASALGTTVDNIEINDMAVNPISKTIYFGVTSGEGNMVLLKLNGDKFENLDLSNIGHSKMALENAVEKDAKDRRERPLRMWAISDLKYHDGKVLVSGLSNKEFGSTFRSIPFPFDNSEEQASLEIYHAAHGQYETQSPIKTFNVINIDNKDYLMASYTCTPLVLFPMDELKDGVHTKGRTVAELGSGNSPLDMISMSKDGSKYFLMSNTNRPIMKLKYEDISSFNESLTTPVEESAKSEGVDYISLPMVNVLQLDNYTDDSIVYVQRTSDGALVLRSRSI